MPFNQFTQLQLPSLPPCRCRAIFAVAEMTPREVDEARLTWSALRAPESGEESWLGSPIWRENPLAGDVRFDDVTLMPHDQTVLANLTLPANLARRLHLSAQLVLVKTTVTNLINRFYDVRSGTITYDGIPINDIKKSAPRSSWALFCRTHICSRAPSQIIFALVS